MILGRGRAKIVRVAVGIFRACRELSGVLRTPLSVPTEEKWYDFMGCLLMSSISSRARLYRSAIALSNQRGCHGWLWCRTEKTDHTTLAPAHGAG